MRLNRCFALSFLLACAFSTVAHADLVYNVTMNTGPLIGHSAAPFSVEFQFNDGSGIGDSNNSVVLSNFNFGTGGAAVGSGTTVNGASGSLQSSVHFTDSSFFNQFSQQFTPGNQLSFQLAFSTNVDAGPTPDQFTFAILDRTGAELPTQSFFDVFVELNINSANPQVQTFASDTTRIPNAGGPALNIAAPTATPITAVPEPNSVVLVGIACAGLGLLIRRKSWR